MAETSKGSPSAPSVPPAGQPKPPALPAVAAKTTVAKKTAARPPARRVAKGKSRQPAPPRRHPVDVLTAQIRNVHFRLLPITIFVAVLMLGVRVGDLWRLATHDAALPDFPTTLASDPAAGAAAKTPDQPPNKAADKPADKPADPAATGAPDKANAQKTEDRGSPLGAIDDQELAKQLSDRRADLDRRTKDLEAREALLNAAEKRVDQKVQELEKMRTEIQNLLKTGDDKQNQQIDNLVGIYEKMKPKDAARIFDEMALPQLLDIVPRMNASKSSLILASMNPVKAKELSTAMLERKNVPSIPQ